VLQKMNKRNSFCIKEGMKLERLFHESRMISFNYSNKVQNYMFNYTIWLLGNADFVNSQSYDHHVF